MIIGDICPECEGAGRYVEAGYVVRKCGRCFGDGLLDLKPESLMTRLLPENVKPTEPKKKAKKTKTKVQKVQKEEKEEKQPVEKQNNISSPVDHALKEQISEMPSEALNDALINLKKRLVDKGIDKELPIHPVTVEDRSKKVES